MDDRTVKSQSAGQTVADKGDLPRGMWRTPADVQKKPPMRSHYNGLSSGYQEKSPTKERCPNISTNNEDNGMQYRNHPSILLLIQMVSVNTPDSFGQSKSDSCSDQAYVLLTEVRD